MTLINIFDIYFCRTVEVFQLKKRIKKRKGLLSHKGKVLPSYKSPFQYDQNFRLPEPSLEHKS